MSKPDQIFNDELERFYATGFETEAAHDAEWSRIHEELRMRAAARLSALREVKEWVLTKQGFAAQSGDWEWAHNLGVVLAKIEEMEQR